MNWYMYAMIIAVVLVIFAGILWNILKSPFSYPYYDKDFNVSGKRNPEINDFIDKYICKYGLCPFSNHYKKVEEGLCSIGRTKTKSGCAETDKSKLNRKRVIELPEKVAAKCFKTV